jgi:diacylglycerol kinase family enzyme
MAETAMAAPPVPEPAETGAGRLRLTRVRVVLNKGGRAVQQTGPEALAEAIRRGFGAQGITAEIAFVDGGELRPALEEAVAQCRSGRAQAVVVGGGDGTVGTSAGVLAGTGVPLGVLPLGTLNHFAKDLGLPLELEDAIGVLAQGRVRSVDLGEVNGTVFVNNSLIGAYPYMVSDRERRRRAHGLGKWLAMALAFLRMLAKFPRRKVTLAAEGATVNYRTPLLFVGVNEYRMNALELRRPRGLDGGQLWLLVAKHRTPLAFLGFALRAAFGGLDEAGDFDTVRTGRADVVTRARRVPVSHDGEVTRMRGPLRYRIRPAALRVLAPPPAAEAS